MPKEFLKSLFWAVSLHGGVLGILLFSWPFLAQSVFSFDRDRIIKVSLVSMDLIGQPGDRETQKVSSSVRSENHKNATPQAASNPLVPEYNHSPEQTWNPPLEDQREKKEPGLGISFSPQVSRNEDTSGEKGRGGENAQAGNNKNLLVVSTSTHKSAVGSTLAIPRYGKNREPYYPATAREQGWQGTALLKVLVLKNGSVGSLEILRSSGYAILDRSALKAVKEWKFIPAHKDGQPVEIGVEVPVTFRLE